MRTISVDTKIAEKIELESFTQLVILDLLRINDYAGLYSILKETPGMGVEVEEDMRELVNKGFLKVNDSYIDPIGEISDPTHIPKIVSLNIDIDTKETPKKRESVIDWIDDWREIFPKGRQGGYPLRGDRKDCVKKMKRFMKENPSISKDEIFEATRKYVEDRKKENYNYIKMANYFIEKSGMSTLSAWLEEIQSGGEEDMDTSEKFKTDL